MSSIWSALVQWSGWKWEGWIALGSIGAVGALLFLAAQTRTLRQQVRSEALARRGDQRREVEDRERALTPILSIYGGAITQSPPEVSVGAKLFADGAGVAFNTIMNFFRVDDAGQHHVTTSVIQFMRAGTDSPVLFRCPPNFLIGAPHLIRIETIYHNMFGQQVRFTHSGRVDQNLLVITDWPVFVWPWPNPPEA